MRHVAALSDVPDDDLKSVIGDFESEGATVMSILQDDGKWTIVAMFPREMVSDEEVFKPTLAANQRGVTGRALVEREHKIPASSG
jgi:hypothetical protein